MSENILEIKNLSVEFCTFDGVVKAINGMSFDVPRGKTVGLVGETGAGKTTTALSVMGLVQSPPGVITEGEILFDGEDLLKAGEAKLRKYRGDKIAESGLHSGAADRQRDHAAPEREQDGGGKAGRGYAGGGGNSKGADGQLSPRVQRGHAAAGVHRHGAGL